MLNLLHRTISALKTVHLGSFVLRAGKTLDVVRVAETSDVEAVWVRAPGYGCLVRVDLSRLLLSIENDLLKIVG